jgi:hypothetical protein
MVEPSLFHERQRTPVTHFYANGSAFSSPAKIALPRHLRAFVFVDPADILGTLVDALPAAGALFFVDVTRTGLAVDPHGAFDAAGVIAVREIALVAEHRFSESEASKKLVFHPHDV